ncbi:hypothetical protein [Burkholderia sp. IMCC1007]|uniref:hypothetical protein n=1 Tax=Burkholderia sp. IMCC1007 TaxID=3004104 RepID=UPI0022B2D27A|nr:hypothetical protein [Burkholderia sp. IMCC1007]
MTTDKSCADALTDGQIDELFFAAKKHGMKEAFRRTARDLLAAPPVEQPAAAPIDDELRIEAMARAMNIATDGHDRYWTGFVPSAGAALRALLELQAAPAPADEREAIPAGWRLMPPSLTQSMRMAMAKAATEYMQRTGGNSPDVIYEAALAAAPQPPAQADAREGLTDEQWEELRLIARTYNEKGFPKHAREFFARAFLTIHPARSEPRAEVTAAARDVLVERRRQIEREGLTPAHDDQHNDCEMALAAIVYAESAVGYHPSCPDTWPWSPDWFKPTTPRRDLVKARALILAEIERLDRAAPAGGA